MIFTILGRFLRSMTLYIIFTGIIIEKDWPLGNSYRDNYTKECWWSY